MVLLTRRTEKLDVSTEMEEEQVPGEDFVFVDAVFGMRPEQEGLQEERGQEEHCILLFFCTRKRS